MKVILISIDQKVLVKDSSVQKRVLGYRDIVDELHVIVLSPEKTNTDSQNIHVAYSCFKPLRLLKALFICLSLTRKKNRKEWLISSQDPFEIGLFSWLIAKVCRISLHVQVHIDFFSPLFKKESFRNAFQNRLAHIVIPRAQSVRVVSQRIGSFLCNDMAIEPNRVLSVPVFVDGAQFSMQHIDVDLRKQYPQFNFFVLVASRFVKQKNIPLAIDAFTFFWQKNKDACLVIIGSGPEKETIQEKINNVPCRENIVLGSWVNSFSSCMKTADVFLLSSDYEGWGMTAVESVSVGLPVVMTDVGCAGEFILDGMNGYVVPTRNADAIATALVKARLHNSALRLATLQSAQRITSENDNHTLIKQSWEHAIID